MKSLGHRSMRAVIEANPADFLSRVHSPVLAIFGENDTAVPVGKSVILYNQYLAETGNNALTIKVFPNASHTIRVDRMFVSSYFDLMEDWLGALQFK